MGQGSESLGEFFDFYEEDRDYVDKDYRDCDEINFDNSAAEADVQCSCDRVSTESGTSCATQRIWMEGRIAELEDENDRLTKLAYIGDHLFPDLTWKARCEELRTQLAARDKEMERMRNRSNRFRNLLMRIHRSVSRTIREFEDEDNPVGKTSLTVGLIRDIRAALWSNDIA